MPLDRSKIEYFEQNIKREDLSGDEVKGKRFYDCVLDHCSFNETVLRKCRFVNCTFKHCDLSLMKAPNSAFRGITFEDSQLVGVNWADADWQERELSAPLKFLNCALNHSTFIGLHLPDITIHQCVARNVDFREADLTGADLTDTDFMDSIFFHTKLVEADFRRSRNYHINATTNKLDKAKFNLPEAMGLLYALDISLDESDQEA